MARTMIDGNEAAASAAYRLNELCSIYPITPSSTMAELADEWSAQHKPNIYGMVPTVVEMQSEGGAAGALHGALQGGALSTVEVSSPAILYMLGIISSRPWEAVNVVLSAPPCRAPCRAPAAPPSDCISTTVGTMP